MHRTAFVAQYYGQIIVITLMACVCAAVISAHVDIYDMYSLVIYCQCQYMFVCQHVVQSKFCI